MNRRRGRRGRDSSKIDATLIEMARNVSAGARMHAGPTVASCHVSSSAAAETQVCMACKRT